MPSRRVRSAAVEAVSVRQLIESGEEENDPSIITKSDSLLVNVIDDGDGRVVSKEGLYGGDVVDGIRLNRTVSLKS
jgi:hypothetical protein